MYVRWQSRKRRRPAFGQYYKLRGECYAREGSNEQDIHWRAVLVENERVNGKPTQRHIAYIGGITDSAIAIVHQRCWFWDGVKERLDRVGKRMSPENRKAVEAAVAKKVPRPTKAEYRRCVRDRDARRKGLKGPS
jgi:hypothetical protein